MMRRAQWIKKIYFIEKGEKYETGREDLYDFRRGKAGTGGGACTQVLGGGAGDTGKKK